VGESANLAFYAVVFARGVVPKDKLDEALTLAVGGGKPLEAVLVQTGALKRPQADELVRQREQYGRVCASCEGITYVLEGEGRACEYCGGRLLTREQQRAREAARPNPATPPAPVPPRPARATAPMRAPPPPRPASPQRPARPEPARPEPARPEPAPAEAGRLVELERQVGALARELSDERQARAQMALLLNELTARLEGLAPKVEGAGAAGGEAAVERALAALHERLGVDDLGQLPARISDQVAPRVLQAVRDRYALDDLADLPARAAAHAAQALAERGGAIDEEALAGRLLERLAASLAERTTGGGAPAVDEEALAERVVERVVERVAASATPAPASAPAPVVDEAELVERVLEAAAARQPASDPEALAERVTRRALEAVSERLDRLEPPDRTDEVERATAAAVEQALAPALEAARDAAREETRAALEAAARDLGARLDALGERVGGLGERLDAQPEPVRPEVVARSVEEALRARLDEDLAAVEARVAAASAEVLEALDARVDELAASVASASGASDADARAGLEKKVEALALRVTSVAAQAAKAAEAGRAAAREVTEQLDDPRDLLARALAQAEERVAGTIDARVAALREEVGALARRVEALAAAPAPASPPAGAAELADRLDTLEARLAARTDRTARAADDARRAEAAARSAVQEAIEALEARLEPRLEAALARAAAPEPSPAAGRDGEEAVGEEAQARVIQRAVQAVWDQLASLDLPGLPARVSEQVLASVTKKLDGDMPALVDTIAQEATAPVLRSIETRLKKLDLERLPAKLAAEVTEKVTASLGADDDPLAATLVERVTARLADGAAPARAEAPSRAERSAGAPPATDVEGLIDRAAARALEWVEDRLTALEQGGGVEMELARAAARAAAAEVVERRVAEVEQRLLEARPAGGASLSAVFDGDKTMVSDPNKSGVLDRDGPKTGAYDKKFVALAREVKSLKEVVERLEAGGAPSGDLVAVLSSSEFKAAFDAKMKEVLTFIRTDLVPSAVKRAMAPEASS
jgi:hypothetical protein